MRRERIIEVMEQMRVLLERHTQTITALLLFIIALIVNLGVFCRYVLFAPLPWSEQIPKYAMVWMGFLGASVGISQNRHIGFDVLIARLPLMVRKAIILAGRLLIMFFLVFMTSYGISLAFAVGFISSAPMLGIPMFYLLLAVPTGGILMISQLAIRIVLDLLSLNE